MRIVEEADLKMAGSAAILRHLARKTGLLRIVVTWLGTDGANERERAQCDMWDDFLETVPAGAFPLISVGLPFPLDGRIHDQGNSHSRN